MGRLRELVEKVRDDVGPIASSLKEEWTNQIEKVREEVSTRAETVRNRLQPTRNTPRDDWSFEAAVAQNTALRSIEEDRQSSVSPKEIPSMHSEISPSTPDVRACDADVHSAPIPSQIRITAQPSATDPAVCKFTVEVPIYEERLVRIRNRDGADLSPLAQRLFELEQVSAISFSGNVVTVSKVGPEPWQVIARQVGPIIRAHIGSGEPAVLDAFWELPQDSSRNLELFDRVKEVIDNIINPGVAGHGGFVSLLGVEGDTAYVQMGGGCHGCGMADLTLKQGIVSTIRSQVPEIAQVLDQTDHESGANPYFAH